MNYQWNSTILIYSVIPDASHALQSMVTVQGIHFQFSSIPVFFCIPLNRIPICIFGIFAVGIPISKMQVLFNKIPSLAQRSLLPWTCVARADMVPMHKWDRRIPLLICKWRALLPRGSLIAPHTRVGRCQYLKSI